MNRSIGCSLLILGSVIVSSCGSISGRVIQPTGDMVTITTSGTVEYAGEFLAVDDSAMYLHLSADGREGEKPVRWVCSLLLTRVQSVEIAGYANRDWVGPVVLFEAVPTVLLTIAAGSVKGGPGLGATFLICSIPTVLTFIAFEASTPPAPRFEQPLTHTKVEELRKYARFPQGLAQSQMEQLLQHNQQTKIRELR